MRRLHGGNYFTYITASRSHTLYIGVSGDPHKRVFQHRWEEREDFTARYNCNRLVWFEGQDDVSKAIARETELKGWKRARKLPLIESLNPAWIDLSRDWHDWSLLIIVVLWIACIPENNQSGMEICSTQKA